MSTVEASVAAELEAIVGSEHVVTDRDELEYLSADISFEPYAVAQVAVAPGTAEETAACVRVAAAAGLAVVARGGGMSYTQGYTPAREGTMVVDARRLNAIREVNARDGYVTAEAGVTWEQLYEALAEHGARTPYYGPISGRFATVGGALSQNSLFYGSGQHGTVADAALGLEVVLADGRTLHTGSWARTSTSPFLRWDGPDLTGMFLGDTGAMGVKTAATLRLIPRPEITSFLSFGVDDFAASIDLTERLSATGLAAEVYGFDPYYHAVFVRTGFEYFADVPYSVHVAVEGTDQGVVDASVAALQRVAGDARAIENSLPPIFRKNPFGSVDSLMLGPGGELWLPIHAFLPWSRAQEAREAVDAYLEENREVMERFGMATSLLTATSGHCFVYEPSFYWPDAPQQFRLDKISPSWAEELRGLPPQPEAREAALALRRGLAEVFDRAGAVHIQIAKYYAYQELLEPTSREVLAGVKAVVDPEGRMNPGNLGLAT